MRDSPIEQQGHPDELLPWFVNKTLPADERHVVEQHIASCHQCQEEIVLLEKMRAQVKEAPIQSPGEFGLNRLLKEVRNEQTVSEVQRPKSSGWWKAGLAIAASLIIFIQAGLLIDTWYLSKPVAPLSGPLEQGLVLQVSFAPTATESQIREVVGAVHGTFIDGPSQLGIYRIRLNKLSPDNGKVEQMIEQLRQRKKIIRHVAQD